MQRNRALFKKLKLHPSVCGTMSRALRYTPLVKVPTVKCRGLPNDEFQIKKVRERDSPYTQEKFPDGDAGGTPKVIQN